MTKEVKASFKQDGKTFEILVDVDMALQLKDGVNVNIANVLMIDEVFSDVNKGKKAGREDMEEVFGTDEVRKVAEHIIKKGRLQLPAEYKKKKQEKRLKKVVNFISKNAVNPQNGNPHTDDRIREAIKETGVNISDEPIEEQIGDIMSEIKKVIPIKIDTKKLKVTVPATHSGKVYGLLKKYKEDEEWLSNGDLKCTINIPAGIQMEFYNKLNDKTHGSAVVEEVKDK